MSNIKVNYLTDWGYMLLDAVLLKQVENRCIVLCQDRISRATYNNSNQCYYIGSVDDCLVDITKVLTYNEFKI